MSVFLICHTIFWSSLQWSLDNQLVFFTREKVNFRCFFLKVFFTSLQMMVCAVDVSGVSKFYLNDCPFACGIVFHNLRAQNQGHHTIDRLEERGVEGKSARRSSFKGRERAIVNQTNIGTVSKATMGKLLREGVERIWVFRAHIYIYIYTILNWTKLNLTLCLQSLADNCLKTEGVKRIINVIKEMDIITKLDVSG